MLSTRYLRRNRASRKRGVRSDHCTNRVPNSARSGFKVHHYPFSAPWPLRLFGEPGYRGILLMHYDAGLAEAEKEKQELERLFPEAQITIRNVERLD